MLFLVGMAACGKSASRSEVEACDRMAKLCGEEFSSTERKECVEDWPNFRKQFGEETANKFLTCTREAKSCAEVMGCAVGVLGNMGKDFEKGLDKMMDEDAIENAEPLPPECKRADEVCSKDEPFARDKCRDMVGNLKADTANLTALTTCYAAAKNCFDFKKCTTDMWFKLN